jgi:hypothetical protein
MAGFDFLFSKIWQKLVNQDFSILKINFYSKVFYFLEKLNGLFETQNGGQKLRLRRVDFI